MRRGRFVDRGRTLRGHRPRLSRRVLVSLGRLPPEIAFGLGLHGRRVGGRPPCSALPQFKLVDPPQHQADRRD